MIDQFIRQGRSYNMTLLKGSQNATDHEDSANMSMKFSFQLEKREEAVAMLHTFNVEASEEYSNFNELRTGRMFIPRYLRKNRRYES